MAIATEYEAHLEWCRNVGADQPERAWILSPYDVWERNPFYHGPAVPHPEDYQDEDEEYGPWQPSSLEIPF